MRSFSASDILMLFDQGAGLHAIDQALLVLRYAMPEADYDKLVRLPLGQRDRFCSKYGSGISAIGWMPIRNVRPARSDWSSRSRATLLLKNTRATQPVTKRMPSKAIHFDLRCPDSADAAAAVASESVEAAEKHFTRCIRARTTAQFTVATHSAQRISCIAAELAALRSRGGNIVGSSCPFAVMAGRRCSKSITFYGRRFVPGRAGSCKKWMRWRGSIIGTKRKFSP